MPIPSSNISSTLKTKGPLRAPSNDLPPVHVNPIAIEQEKKQQLIHETEAVVPSMKIKTSLPTPSPILEEIQVKSDVIQKQPIEEIQVR
jgi:hypothetical protein